MFLSLKTLYRKRTVIWPFTFTQLYGLYQKLPNLYSFDIFDTIIQRKTLRPDGIFFYIKDKLLRMNTDLPFYLIQNYPRVRIQAENYVRDYYKNLNLYVTKKESK